MKTNLAFRYSSGVCPTTLHSVRRFCYDEDYSEGSPHWFWAYGLPPLASMFSPQFSLILQSRLKQHLSVPKCTLEFLSYIATANTRIVCLLISILALCTIQLFVSRSLWIPISLSSLSESLYGGCTLATTFAASWVPLGQSSGACRF